MESADRARLDKWLWAVRFFKTRADAAKVCANGRVKRAGQVSKAASLVKPGDEFELPFAEGPGIRRVCVVLPLQQRVSPALARQAYEDLTDQETLIRQRDWHETRRDAPRGRPTKKDRRELGKLKGFFE